ncbi:hypothetical protein SPB21_03695 [Leptothoe sp. ISB3NOV94-8A]
MGEAKRRKATDPNYGNPPDLMVSCFCQICVEGSEGGRFQRHVDAALDQSIDLHQDLLSICMLEACIKYPSVGIENMRDIDIAGNYLGAAISNFKEWGLHPTEDNVSKALDRVDAFLKEKALKHIDEIEKAPKTAIESFFKAYAYAQS